jgi:hypothetical protein
MYASAKVVPYCYIDLNGKQIDGSTDEVLAGSIRANEATGMFRN